MGADPGGGGRRESPWLHRRNPRGESRLQTRCDGVPPPRPPRALRYTGVTPWCDPKPCREGVMVFLRVL